MASTSLSNTSGGPDFRSLNRAPPPDPDVQATLSDFLTYTEHFPSHLTRALALIEGQRIRAERHIKKIHENTTAYSVLPSITENKPDPIRLRKEISHALDEAERACGMALEEAVRMDDECAREHRRLNIVVDKLKSQPLPPSRDPTPEQQALTSPNLKRERRMSVRVDEPQAENPARRMHNKAASKLRGRKIMVPGEVLPPPDPNAPPESVSDWTSPRQSPPLEELPAADKKGAAPGRPRSRTPKLVKMEHDRGSLKARGPRAPGQPGTNAHSAVAGISTSNALLALTQPPDDAPKGSKWLPWMKLTEWEMAKLRKRMKKNAVWVPSQTMVRRELKNLGRGVAGKEAAKAEAEAGGDPFVDENNEPDPTKVLISGEESAQIIAILGTQAYVDDEDADAELINRGMRLNEAKKLKRQRLLEEQALQAQLAREQGVEVPNETTRKASSSPQAQKKRKRETTPAPGALNVGVLESPDPLTRHSPVLKKLKISAPSAGGLSTSKVPLAPAGVSWTSKLTSNRNRRTATPPAARKPTITLKVGKAVSEEPPNRRAALRRSSIASMPNGNAPGFPQDANGSTTKSGRRSKRPAPGILTSNDNESAKVGVSKRKAAPRKKVSLSKKDLTTLETLAIDPPEEEIDPNEPRYCTCGDVSWGTMIACDNDDCEKEWFHLECVQLDGMPPRRTKWYCPDCRKKLKMGQTTNGLVGKVVGPQGR